MASILTAADRELVATLDKDDAKRMDLKSPGDIFYKTNEIFHAASAAVGSLNPYVGSVAFTMTIDVACGGGKAMNVPFIVVG